MREVDDIIKGSAVNSVLSDTDAGTKKCEADDGDIHFSRDFIHALDVYLRYFFSDNVLLRRTKYTRSEIYYESEVFQNKTRTFWDRFISSYQITIKGWYSTKPDGSVEFSNNMMMIVSYETRKGGNSFYMDLKYAREKIVEV